MRRVQAREPEAVDELGRRLHTLPRRLRAWNARLPRPLDEPEFLDRIQDATYHLLRRLGTFDGRASIETWAYRFCTNHLLDGVRYQRRRPASLTDETSLAEERVDPVNDHELDGDVDLESALQVLGDQERRIVHLKHYGGHTFEEIGTQLGISPNTVKTRYYRGMVKLREFVRARHPDLFHEDEA